MNLAMSMPWKKGPRILRTDGQRVRDCATHVRFLKEAMDKYEEGDFERYKQMAMHLRVLVCESQRNRPLLLDLIDKFDVDFRVRRRGTETKISLREWINTEYVCGVGRDALTSAELIWEVGSQMSGHEDHAILAILARLETMGGSPRLATRGGSARPGAHAEAMFMAALMAVQANERMQKAARAQGVV